MGGYTTICLPPKKKNTHTHRLFAVHKTKKLQKKLEKKVRSEVLTHSFTKKKDAQHL